MYSEVVMFFYPNFDVTPNIVKFGKKTCLNLCYFLCVMLSRIFYRNLSSKGRQGVVYLVFQRITWTKRGLDCRRVTPNMITQKQEKMIPAFGRQTNIIFWLTLEKYYREKWRNEMDNMFSNLWNFISYLNFTN
jgi:hypothetical protein